MRFGCDPLLVSMTGTDTNSDNIINHMTRLGMVCNSICLSIYLSIYHLCLYLCIYLIYIHVRIYLFIYLRIRLVYIDVQMSHHPHIVLFLMEQVNYIVVLVILILRSILIIPGFVLIIDKFSSIPHIYILSCIIKIIIYIIYYQCNCLLFFSSDK